MNKIIVSIVLAVILVVGINKVADTVYHVEKLEKSVYQVEGLASVEGTTNTEVNSVVSDSGNIMALFASVNADDGAKVFKKCTACHSIAQNGANKIGPALWGVLGRKTGAVTDYKYSKAMVAHGKEWSFEEMNSYLIKPQAHIKGTKMAFAGLRKEKDRASVILYMNSKSNSPKLLP